MKGQQDFKAFLREKYEDGKALVDHPDPKLREQRRDRDEPRIKFWTAMKYPSFKERVKREFAAWNQQMEQKRPRAALGERVRDIAQMRRGDFIQHGLHGQRYKVLRFTAKGSVVLAEVDTRGRPTSDRVRRMTPSTVRKERLRRLDELKRDEVSSDDVKKFVDGHLGHPPSSIDSRDAYRAWLDKNLRENSKSPYHRLGEDEPEHEARLNEQIDKTLEEIGVGDDWKWEAPPRARVGERIRHPKQLEAGDFVQQRGLKYRVKKVTDDDQIKLVYIDENGRPFGYGNREIGLDTLQDEYTPAYKRVETVERPRPTIDEIKKFVDDHIGFPPSDVDSQAKYRKWLDEQLRETKKSPYLGLDDEDELEHKALLKKQVDEILEDRGVGKSWKWAPPPPVQVGERVHHPAQLQVGHFFRERGGHGWKVISFEPDGLSFKAVRIGSNGRPDGAHMTFNARELGRRTYDRTDPIQRPAVSRDDAARFAANSAADPGRAANDYDSYRAWLMDKFLNSAGSPYYQVADDEKTHQRTLEQHVDSILKDRGIGKDWKWKGPSLVEFPADVDWARAHDAVRRAVLEGVVVRHPEAPRGRMDKMLGGGAGDAEIRRVRDASGKERDYVFKRLENEPAVYRQGTPVLHTREAAAYGIDRLLGDGTVVPPTASDGTGSYQQFVEADDWGMLWSPGGIRDEDLASHPDIQRMLFFDDLIGHEDRHFRNVMYSWKDPTGPKTADNLQIHAIDNGFSLADFDEKRKKEQMVLQRDRILPFRPKVYEDVLRKMPPELHEKFKALKVEDVLRNMVESGIKDKGALRALAVRLRSLQDNPEVLAKFIDQASPNPNRQLTKHQSGRQEWHWMAGKHPEDLLRDHTSLDPKETLREIDAQIKAALSAPSGSRATAR